MFSINGADKRVNNNKISECIEEKSVPKGMCDVFIPTVGNEALIIEVKNGKKPINVDDIVQVQRYVTSEGQRFAILSKPSS